MDRDSGRSAAEAAPGCSAEPEPSCTVSAVPASIPNAWPLGGYAPGGYTGQCNECGKEWIGQDKRSWQCLECAAKSSKAAFQALRGLYDELILAVARRYPGESRHETALRYIREREDGGTAIATEARRAETTGSACEGAAIAQKERPNG